MSSCEVMPTQATRVSHSKVPLPIGGMFEVNTEVVNTKFLLSNQSTPSFKPKGPS